MYVEKAGVLFFYSCQLFIDNDRDLREILVMKRRDFIKKSVQAGAAVVLGSSVLGCQDSSGSGDDEEKQTTILYQTDTFYLFQYNPDTASSTPTSISTYTSSGFGHFSISSDRQKMVRMSSSYDILDVSSLDGSNTVTVNNSGYGYNPKFSPDGSKVVFDNNDWIWSASSSTADSDVESGYNGIHPAWSPDGTKIACRNTGGRIGIADATTSTFSSIGDTGCNIHQYCIPNWSPDGSKILHFRSSGYYDLGFIPSSAPFSFTQLHNFSTEMPINPQFSPDGTQVAYANASGEVWVWDYDGSTTLSNHRQLSGISNVKAFEWRGDS